MWERGDARPGCHYRRGLAAFVGLSETELGLGLSAYIVDVDLAHEEEDTKRREMISSMVAAGMALYSAFAALPVTPAREAALDG